jgi:hypothetical protein
MTSMKMSVRKRHHRGNGSPYLRAAMSKIKNDNFMRASINKINSIQRRALDKAEVWSICACMSVCVHARTHTHCYTHAHAHTHTHTHTHTHHAHTHTHMQGEGFGFPDLSPSGGDKLLIKIPVDFYEQTQYFVNVSVGTPRQV